MEGERAELFADLRLKAWRDRRLCLQLLKRHTDVRSGRGMATLT